MNRMFKNISVVPIEYSNLQIHAIQRLKITNTKQFKFCGLNYEFPFDRIVEYFKLSTSNIHEDCIIYTRLIYDIISMVSNIKKTNSSILIIRLSLPTDEFKIPRLHHDGSFFKPKNGRIIQEKFLLSIKGEGTLICEPEAEDKEKFYDMLR